jgi:acyl-coenzyme A thioesterase PaaI-like protein
VVGHFTPGRDHAGYAGRMHGGILSALLDECMAWACAVERRSFCVTGDLRIRFKSTARLGEEIEVTGVAETGWGHYLHASGEANSAGGAMLATATATFAEPLHCACVK